MASNTEIRGSTTSKEPSLFSGTLYAADRAEPQMPPLKLVALCVSPEALTGNPFLKEG
jgi:hypothetical protein